MMPPRVVPWPPMNFVAEWTTISAPCSMGRIRYGVPKVLSITTGIPCLWAICAIASISGISLLGFPRVSRKTALVLSRIASSTSERLWASTKVVSMPYWGSVWARRLKEPPYMVFCATICPPFAARASMVYVMAAAPDASARAALPPSRAAIRFSSTSWVELVSLPYILPGSASPNRSAACLLLWNT